MFPLRRIVCSAISTGKSSNFNYLRATTSTSTSTSLRIITTSVDCDRWTNRSFHRRRRRHKQQHRCHPFSSSCSLSSSPISLTTTTTIKATTTKAAKAAAIFSIALVQSSCLSTQALAVATSSSNNDSKIMPQSPYQYRANVVDTGSSLLLDLTTLSNQISKHNTKQQKAYDTSRSLQVAINKATNAIEFQHPKQTEILEELKLSILSAIHHKDKDTDGGSSSNSKEEGVVVDRRPRLANLQNRVEDYVRLLAYDHFLKTGTLLPPTQTSSFATDEEYLAGACMGLCHDLARYGLGRATARDVDSVVAARNLLQAILQYLLRFDFRNGYLRRKYDGTKYALKSLETILYELSVTGATLSEEGKGEEKEELDPSSSSSLTPVDELDAILSRLTHRDELRETLIKKCRDGQKAAKQAIYALHRGDVKQSSRLLKSCENCILKDLMPIIEEEPPLRHGSFSNVLEEYAEAKLFFAWLHGNDNDDASNDDSKGEKDKQVSGILLKPEDFSKVPLEPDEYLGGVCDLTGEIGRFAVQRGTVRDLDGVKTCLEANAAVQDAIQSLDERLPGGVSKKLDQLRRSVQKIERMMYEMSLSEAAGGRKVDASEDIKIATTNDE